LGSARCACAFWVTNKRPASTNGTPQKQATEHWIRWIKEDKQTRADERGDAAHTRMSMALFAHKLTRSHTRDHHRTGSNQTCMYSRRDVETHFIMEQIIVGTVQEEVFRLFRDGGEDRPSRAREALPAERHQDDVEALEARPSRARKALPGGRRRVDVDEALEALPGERRQVDVDKAFGDRPSRVREALSGARSQVVVDDVWRVVRIVSSRRPLRSHGDERLLVLGQQGCGRQRGGGRSRRIGRRGVRRRGPGGDRCRCSRRRRQGDLRGRWRERPPAHGRQHRVRAAVPRQHHRPKVARDHSRHRARRGRRWRPHEAVGTVSVAATPAAAAGDHGGGFLM
jgi:hypothetical protein